MLLLLIQETVQILKTKPPRTFEKRWLSALCTQVLRGIVFRLKCFVISRIKSDKEPFYALHFKSGVI